MGILKDKIENTDDSAADAGAQTADVATEATESPAQIAARAVATHQASAVVKAAPKVNARVLDGLKDAMRVDYDTLASLKLNQGRIIDGETETSLGEHVTIRLLGWQESWLVSPGDMNAPKNLMRYADNSETSEDGTNLNEHLKDLLKIYPNAKKQHRCVLAGALIASDKPSPLVNNLVQIDLSPKSKTAFDRYRATAAWNLSTGKCSEDQVQTFKMTAVVADGPNKTTYTKATFEVAPV